MFRSIPQSPLAPILAELHLVEQVSLGALGAIVGGGLLMFTLFRCSGRWRLLAAVYEKADLEFERTDTLQPENCILRSREGLSQSYAGIAAISVTEQGVGLRLMTPLHLVVPFHPPLYFPREEISLKPVYGFFSPAHSPSYALMVQRVPELEIVVRDSVIERIEEMTGIERGNIPELVSS